MHCNQCRDIFIYYTSARPCTLKITIKAIKAELGAEHNVKLPPKNCTPRKIRQMVIINKLLNYILIMYQLNTLK